MSDIKMTEVEQVKEAIKDYADGDYSYCSTKQFMKWLTSLITTIESQKEEIERVRKAAKHWQDRYDGTATEIESLKAITELAVKGLKEIKPVLKWKTQNDYKDCVCPFCDSLLVLNLTLSEIARLQNEQT